MKKYILSLIFYLTIYYTAFNQCGINQKELRDNYCTGTYLVHSELDNTSPDVEIALKKGNMYAIYLLNPDHDIKSFKMTNSHNVAVKLESHVFSRQSVYKFVPQVSDTYRFHVDFGTASQACVLWTVYQQNENHLVPGFYRNFEELKFNNPSSDFNFKVTPKTKKYNGSEITTYRISIDRKKAKETGRTIGFSDGKYLYLNEDNSSLKPTTEFVRAEFIGNNYYYEIARRVPFPTGTTVIIIPVVYEKIMDMNTGKITTLGNRAIKEIMSDNHQLLEEFDNSSHKNRLYKEFLIRYYSQKFSE